MKGSILSIDGTAIPNYVWFAIALTAIMWFIWNKTTFGKNMFAWAPMRRRPGLRRQRLPHHHHGLCPGRRHVRLHRLYRGRPHRLQHRQHRPQLRAGRIAACVIGGVSFVGGIGKIRGIVIGVLMLRLIFVGLNMIGINQDLFYIIKGGIILFACALDMRKYLVKR